MLQELKEAYGFIFEDELIQEISETGVLKTAREGEIIMDINDYVNSMPLLLNGAIKILREDKDPIIKIREVIKAANAENRLFP